MHEQQYEHEVFNFGDVRVELASRRVVRCGKICLIEPKAFSVLWVLMQHAGLVVTKEQLLDVVWGHRHVTTGVLTRIISQLRQTLGDNPSTPLYIETVHTFGYRFIGNVVTKTNDATRAFSPIISNDSNGIHPILGRRTGDAAYESASEDDAILARDHYVIGRRHWYERTTHSLNVALDHFRKSVSYDPNYAQSWCGLADTYLLLHEYDSMTLDDAERLSRSAIIRALELKPDMGEAYAALGLLEIQLQHYTVATALLEQAAAQCPRISHIHAWLGMALTLDGRLIAAEEILMKAMQHDNDNVVLLTTMAMNQTMQANEASAEQMLLHAMAINPNYLEIYWQQAWLRAQFGHLSMALQALVTANRVIGDNDWTNRYLAQLYLIADCPEQASEIIEKIQDVNKWQLLWPQIDNYCLTNKHKEAIEVLKALIAEHPLRKENIILLAQCYAESGEIENALSAFEVAYQGDPQRGDTALHSWGFNLGLGVRANQVALLDQKQPKRKRVLNGLRSQMDHLYEGGTRIPNLYYQYAVIEALAGDETLSLDWLDKALDKGFCNALAFKKSLAWRTFSSKELLALRIQRLQANVLVEKKKMLRLH